MRRWVSLPSGYPLNFIVYHHNLCYTFAGISWRGFPMADECVLPYGSWVTALEAAQWLVASAEAHARAGRAGQAALDMRTCEGLLGRLMRNMAWGFSGSGLP